MKKQSIVFFDLDGTLLTSNFNITSSTIEAIHELQKQGIETVIATGRNMSEIGSILEVTGIRSCIAMNGQYVQYDGKLIYDLPLDENEVKALHVAAAKNAHDLAFYTPEQITVTAKDSKLIAKNYYERVGTEYPPVDDSIYLHTPIHLMVLFCEEGEEVFYKEHFPYFQFVRHSPLGCDVYPTGISKATGINQLIKHRNLSMEDSYAFGDGLNDLEMFQQVKHSVAMGNAVELLKKGAKFVTTSNDEDGIRNGLRQCGLI